MYCCVGNTVVNDANIDAGALVAQMETKANIQLDNVLPSQEFKNKSISWGVPDYEATIGQATYDSCINIAIPWNTAYQLPCDALIFYGGNAGGVNDDFYLKISFDNKEWFTVSGHDSGYMATCVATFAKGTYVKAMGGNGYQSIGYVPLKGANQ